MALIKRFVPAGVGGHEGLETFVCHVWQGEVEIVVLPDSDATSFTDTCLVKTRNDGR